MKMLTILTTGQYPVLRCDRCNATFTGPKAREWRLAHFQGESKREETP